MCDDMCAEEGQQTDGQPLVSLHPGVAVEKHYFARFATFGEGEPQYEA